MTGLRSRQITGRAWTWDTGGATSRLLVPEQSLPLRDVPKIRALNSRLRDVAPSSHGARHGDGGGRPVPWAHEGLLSPSGWTAPKARSLRRAVSTGGTQAAVEWGRSVTRGRKLGEVREW